MKNVVTIVDNIRESITSIIRDRYFNEEYFDHDDIIVVNEAVMSEYSLEERVQVLIQFICSKKYYNVFNETISINWIFAFDFWVETVLRDLNKKYSENDPIVEQLKTALDNFKNNIVHNNEVGTDLIDEVMYLITEEIINDLTDRYYYDIVDSKLIEDLNYEEASDYSAEGIDKVIEIVVEALEYLKTFGDLDQEFRLDVWIKYVIESANSNELSKFMKMVEKYHELNYFTELGEMITIKELINRIRNK